MKYLSKLILTLLIFTAILMKSKGQSIYEDLQGSIDIIVDQSGAGDFTTVGGAIGSIPDNNASWKIIFIKNGVYHEKIVLNHKKTKVILLGENVDSTIITYDDYAAKFENDEQDGHTFSTYTFRSDAHDFQAYNNNTYTGKFIKGK